MANRFLNNIRVNDSYTLPTDDGSDGQAIITDGSGNLSFGSVAAASADNAEAIHLEAKNTSGATINKGTPVYITGNVGNTDKLEIAPADASDASKMPAVGLLETTLSNNSEGYVAQGGYLKDLATATIDGTSTSSNDTVYVKAGGGLTMTKPTGTNYIQNVAKVARVHSSNGSLIVSSILRTNDVPTPLHIDHTNQRLGIGVNPSEKLQVNGSVRMSNGSKLYTNGGITIGSDDDGSGAGNIVFQTNGGSERMRITSGGDVGIGTTSPTAKTDIRTSASSGGTSSPTFRAFGYDTDSYFEVNNNVNNSANIKLTRSDAATMFSIDGHSGTTFFNGNVGINETSPDAALTALNGTGDGEVAIFSGTDKDRGLSISTFNVDGYGQVGVDLNAQYSNSPTMTFSNGGTERMRIDSNGNVGIGTDDPRIELHVKNTGNVAVRVETDGTTDLTAIQFGDSDISNVGRIVYDHSDDAMLLYTSNSEQVRIDSSGNVGIGTDSPTEAIHVLSGGNISKFESTTGTGNVVIKNSTTTSKIGSVSGNLVFDLDPTDAVANSNIIFKSDATERMRIDSSGNVGIGENNPSSTLHVKKDNTSPQSLAKFENTTGQALVQIKSENDTLGILEFADSEDGNVGAIQYDHSGNSMRFKTGDAERMRITEAGNVGIGSTSPAVSLDINATDAVALPAGTTAQRPSSPAAGMFRYNTDDNQFEGYTTEWGAIAGSGGGGGTSTFNKDLFDGDDSTTSFTMAQSISDENNTQVYIDGVYQSKENYTINGTAINFSTAPPSGTNNIEVISISSVTVEDTQTLTRDGFTGDGSTTSFTLSVTPTSEDLTFVYIQGVYQEKSTYSLSGSTITFASAPQNGYTFEVMSLTAANITQTSYMASDEFSNPTQDQTSFTLVNGTPSNKSFTMVFISGVFQDKSTYSLTSGAIVLSEGVDAEDTVEVISIGNGGLIGKAVSDANDARYSVNVISNSTTAVAGAVYVFTADLTLTLPASPEVGESIKISNRSGVETCVLGRNGNKILGAAEDLTLDTASASFELIYSGTAQGWIIIGQ